MWQGERHGGVSRSLTDEARFFSLFSIAVLTRDAMLISRLNPARPFDAKKANEATSVRALQVIKCIGNSILHHKRLAT
jgi:hypothetical protein